MPPLVYRHRAPPEGLGGLEVALSQVALWLHFQVVVEDPPMVADHCHLRQQMPTRLGLRVLVVRWLLV